jgi:dipeptidase E
MCRRVVSSDGFFYAYLKFLNKIFYYSKITFAMKKCTPTIFAIGGGDIGVYETLPIDRQIVGTASRQRIRRRGKIKALFMPTASGDDQEYCDTFAKIYGRKLGCATDSLLLYGQRLTKISIKRQIDWCDLVYVGGGSTPAMIKMWRKYDIDKHLHRAWQKGTVMAGLSAGAICWFRYGISDAYPHRWTTVSCLGFVDLACNVHYDSQRGRKQAFDKLVAKKKITGVALGDNACIKITGDRYEIIKAKRNAGAYWVFGEGGKVKRVEIETAGKLCR